MKLFVKLMMLLLVLALAGPYFLKGPDGQPLADKMGITMPSFTMPKLRMPNFSFTDLFGQNKTVDGEDVEQHRSAVTVKFQDEDGVWHFGNQVDMEGMKTFYKWRDDSGRTFYSDERVNETDQIVYVDPETNIVKAFAVSSSESEAVSANVDEQTASEQSFMPSLTTVPLSEVPALIQQTKDVKLLMEQRNDALEAITGD